MLLITLIEVAVVAAVIWAVFNEERIADWEERTFKRKDNKK